MVMSAMVYMYRYHRMNERHSFFVFYNIKNIFCHLEDKITYIYWERNSVLIAPFQVKGHRSVTLHSTI